MLFFFFPAKRIWGKNRYLTKKWHEFNYSLFWGYNIVCSPINQERKLSRKLRIPCREHRMQLKNLNNSNRDGQPPAQRGIWSSLVMTPHTSTLFITSTTFPEQRTPVLGPPSLKSKQPFPMGDPECTLEQSQRDWGASLENTVLDSSIYPDTTKRGAHTPTAEVAKGWERANLHFTQEAH